MQEVMILATVLVPIITAGMQVLKNTVNLPKNLVPLVALVTGLIIGLIASPFTDLTIELRLWAGAFGGLASVGLFELGNKRGGKTKEEDEL